MPIQIESNPTDIELTISKCIQYVSTIQWFNPLDITQAKIKFSHWHSVFRQINQNCQILTAFSKYVNCLISESTVFTKVECYLQIPTLALHLLKIRDFMLYSDSCSDSALKALYDSWPLLTTKAFDLMQGRLCFTHDFL